MSGGTNQDQLDDAVMTAIQKGMAIVEPRDNWLLLDLDDDSALAIYELRYRDLVENFGAHEVERWRSKSGVGTHVIVELAVGLRSEEERIALQASCGSDGLRELLAIACLYDGCERPSVLFKPSAEPVVCTCGHVLKDHVYSNGEWECHAMSADVDPEFCACQAYRYEPKRDAACVA